jgi:hypothetical protein
VKLFKGNDEQIIGKEKATEAFKKTQKEEDKILIKERKLYGMKSKKSLNDTQKWWHCCPATTPTTNPHIVSLSLSPSVDICVINIKRLPL